MISRSALVLGADPAERRGITSREIVRRCRYGGFQRTTESIPLLGLRRAGREHRADLAHRLGRLTVRETAEGRRSSPLEIRVLSFRSVCASARRTKGRESRRGIMKRSLALALA